MIREILDKIDQSAEKTDEHQISSAIKKDLPEIPDSDPSIELLAESMAFDFCENYPDKVPGWGTYYGPKITMGNDDGTYTEYPSLTRVDAGILDHWITKAHESKHPVLRARYADLVWDLTQPTTDSRPDVSMAHISIDSILEIAKKDLHTREADVKFKLRRALNLALSISDVKRIESVRDTIIDFEAKIGDDTKPGLWGFSFDYLVSNAKARLNADQEAKIIEQLEERLIRATDSVEPAAYPIGVEESASRLASYYRRRSKPEDAKRVLQRYAAAFIRAAESAHPLQASGWLQGVLSVLTSYGLKEEVNQITLLLQQLGPDVQGELKPISFSFDIPKVDITRIVEQITDGDLESVMRNIAHNYVPSRQQMENQIQELAKDNPISFLIPRQIIGADGRPVAAVGSLDDDFDGQIVMQLIQTLSFSAIFLRPVIVASIEKFGLTAEKVTDYLFLSPIFQDRHRKIIVEGLNFLLNGDHLAAAHILVPQVEAAIRNLVGMTSSSIWRQDQNGGLNVKLLDELLREEVTINTLGEDGVLYLRVLYTDKRGWNIRNLLSHGMMGYDSFTESTTHRILHSLLFLALVRERPNPE